MKNHRIESQGWLIEIKKSENLHASLALIKLKIGWFIGQYTKQSSVSASSKNCCFQALRRETRRSPKESQGKQNWDPGFLNG